MTMDKARRDALCEMADGPVIVRFLGELRHDAGEYSAGDIGLFLVEDPTGMQWTLPVHNDAGRLLMRAHADAGAFVAAFAPRCQLARADGGAAASVMCAWKN